MARQQAAWRHSSEYGSAPPARGVAAPEGLAVLAGSACFNAFVCAADGAIPVALFWPVSDAVQRQFDILHAVYGLAKPASAHVGL